MLFGATAVDVVHLARPRDVVVGTSARADFNVALGAAHGTGLTLVRPAGDGYEVVVPDAAEVALERRECTLTGAELDTGRRPVDDVVDGRVLALGDDDTIVVRVGLVAFVVRFAGVGRPVRALPWWRLREPHWGEVLGLSALIHFVLLLAIALTPYDLLGRSGSLADHTDHGVREPFPAQPSSPTRATFKPPAPAARARKPLKSFPTNSASRLHPAPRASRRVASLRRIP
jgi:hypothetical protein